MELIDTSATEEARGFDYSISHMRSLGAHTCYRGLEDKTTYHDGFHPFTETSFSTILHHGTEGRKVRITQDFWYRSIASLTEVIENPTKGYFYCIDPTLEEAVGYLDKEE